MNVTETRLYRISGDGNIKAFASITLDECLIINSIQVVEGHNDLYVRMPARKDSRGQWKEIVNPKDNVRRMIRDAVLIAYEESPQNG